MRDGRRFGDEENILFVGEETKPPSLMNYCKWSAAGCRVLAMEKAAS
jgi:hypothetical protein